jgi:2-hydroxy-3-keto-5-methylthiopentenyl-1-phosphate phosphatase
MPRQELFFERTEGDRHIEVIKTYDSSYAQEVFRSMDGDAISALAAALELDSNYDAADIPDPKGSDYEDFIWDELLDTGLEDVRLDPNLRSFFVVSQSTEGSARDLYVSGDWPSAERFAKKLLAQQL